MLYFYLFIGIILQYRSANGIKWKTIENHSSWNKLDKFQCGISYADRIIGGLNATLGQFPWIVRLGYTTNDNEEPEWLCGGALITDRHILTAAHCLGTPELPEYKLTWVRLGELNILTDPDCELKVCAPSVQDIHVKNIIAHPHFNNPAFHNDIAILILKSPAELNDFVSPICLPQKDELGQIKVNDLVTVAGWGKMNMTTEERAEILQYVQIPIVDTRRCDKMSLRGFNISSGEMCAGAQVNKDACGGDSGGPLMKVYGTDSGPKTFIVGAVSFGPTMCGSRKPGVYTSVEYFLKWILDNIN